jgi:Kdo2-lipid IVA lauroyltransferase/acyltransferase
MSIAHHLEYSGLRGLLSLAGSLPPDVASNAGGKLFRGLGPLLPPSRVARRNLEMALPELGAERESVVRGVWENLGRTAAEMPHLPNLERTLSGPGWEIEGAEHLRVLAEGGGPAILFSGHIGNWEMLPRIVAAHGIPMASFYRPPNNQQTAKLLVDMRARAMGMPVPVFPKGADGARSAAFHLARGGFLGILIDQKLNDGIPVDFFGRPAMTAPALASLALRFRCPVVPGYIQRLGPARLRLIVELPMTLPDSGDRAADILTLTRAVNLTLERWVRQRPESWLWLHRRWPKDAAVTSAI